MILTPRWTKLKHHDVQQALWHTPYRFVTVPAGRRSGKTELGKRRIVRAAMKGTRFDNARFFCGAPTYNQAKRIFWDDLKALTPPQFMASKPSESELVISYINGSEIHVVGLDKPERIEGSPWDGAELTEVANMKPNAWPANIRPALADRMGWAVLEGVPEGRNHYYDMDQRAIADMNTPGGEWGSYHWKSADILPASEIAAARRDLDELTFQQEYEASFLNFFGRAYYPFDSRTHVKPLAYDPKQPLIFTFDFNIAPGTAAVIQEQKLPNGLNGTGVINEVFIPRNSNTNLVCDKLLSLYGEHKGQVHCFGDATGGAGGTAKVDGSDWELIKKKFQPVYRERVWFRQQNDNPRERARINAVNTRLQTGEGSIFLMVDPKCVHVIRDFDGVTLVEGGSGELDKKENPELTHLTDGIGYYIEQVFPIDSRVPRRVHVVGV